VVYTQGSELVEPLTRSTISQEMKKRVVCIDVYGSDFGEIYIALDRYMTSASSLITGVEGSTGTSGDDISIEADNTFFGIDPKYFRIAMLRNIGYSPLAKDADTTKAYVFSECGLQVDNPIAGWGASNVTS
jgi:hypothetical protein